MEASHAVLIAIQEEGSDGRLVGRTLLQKKLYFACLLLGEDFGFQPHYYGPYSRQVADATDSLVSNRFLDEQVEVFPDRNVFGERRRHSYTLTGDGQQLLTSGEVGEGVDQWREAFRRINERPLATDFNLLSIAAKVNMILAELGQGTTGDIRGKANEYGWKMSDDQIDQVAQFLEQLGLARRSS